MLGPMNLSTLLLQRDTIGRPVRVGVIGAGKFGTMFLAQARLTKGLHVVAVADLNVPRAKSQPASSPPDGRRNSSRPPRSAKR